MQSIKLTNKQKIVIEQTKFYIHNPSSMQRKMFDEVTRKFSLKFSFSVITVRCKNDASKAIVVSI